MTYGLLDLENPGEEPALLEKLTLLSPTPGLRFLGAYVLPVRPPGGDVPGSDYGFPPPYVGRSYVRPLEGWRLSPGLVRDRAVPVLVGITVRRPGVFTFRGLALDYRVRGIPFRDTYAHFLRVCAPPSDFIQADGPHCDVITDWHGFEPTG